MSRTVVLKSNKYGINLILDDKIPFEQLLADIIKKFEEAEGFFKDAKMALSFEGRKLNRTEEQTIIEAISAHSSVNIVTILDNDAIREQLYKESLDKRNMEDAAGTGLFHKGILRGGQQLVSDASLFVLGDVQAGAKVVAKGNIVVLGALRGTAYAGAEGNRQAFVVALEMDPMQIKIGDVIGRSADKSFPFGKKKKKQREEAIEPQVAVVKDANIYIEPITKGLINNL